jgi:hypothetical protein
VQYPDGQPDQHRPIPEARTARHRPIPKPAPPARPYRPHDGTGTGNHGSTNGPIHHLHAWTRRGSGMPNRVNAHIHPLDPR